MQLCGPRIPRVQKRDGRRLTSMPAVESGELTRLSYPTHNPVPESEHKKKNRVDLRMASSPPQYQAACASYINTLQVSLVSRGLEVSALGEDVTVASGLEEQ